MVSDASIPWYNRPARRFPVHIWLEQRYGFRLPPLRFNPPAQRPVWPRQGGAGRPGLKMSALLLLKDIVYTEVS